MSTRSAGEGGLVWAIGASGLAHGAALAFLALTPSRFEGMSRIPESYSVELVAPSAIGGTHLPGAPAARSKEPPPPLRGESQGVLPAKKPPVPIEEPEPATKPPPSAKLPEAAKATKAKKLPAHTKEPVKKAEAKQEEASVARPLKADKPDKKKPEPPGAAETMQKAKKNVANRQTAKAKAEAEKKDSDLDEQIAAAVRRRADAVNADSKTKSAEEDEIERRIAAAVQRRARDAARAASGIGGSDSTVAGVGPGSGVGGAVRGIEYVMYRNRMESRIKAAWAWAGADRSLRSIVRFNVTAEGKIINVKTIESSGDASYDASVERAIRAADPLGPPPEQYRDEFGTVELEFRAEDARG